MPPRENPLAPGRPPGCDELGSWRKGEGREGSVSALARRAAAKDGIVEARSADVVVMVGMLPW